MIYNKQNKINRAFKIWHKMVFCDVYTISLAVPIVNDCSVIAIVLPLISELQFSRKFLLK